MKHSYFIAFLLMAFLTSCSSDNETTTPETTPTADYFPTENGKFWVYDVTGDFPGRDSLYIANDTMINNSAYKKLKTKELAFGFFTSSLAENGVRKSGDKLLISGATSVSLLQGFPLDFEVKDFTLFKENAIDNEPLALISGTIDYEYDGIPLEFDYTMKSVFKESLASFNVPNYGNYQDVKVIQIILNLQVGGVYEAGTISLPFTLLNAQDVVVSTQYYAKNVGMIYSHTTINYQLNDISQFVGDITIPMSVNREIKEYLDHTNEQ